MLLKSVLDDHPLGRGLGRFVFEYLSGAHEARAFCEGAPRAALHLLADVDPSLAAQVSALTTSMPFPMPLSYHLAHNTRSGSGSSRWPTTRWRLAASRPTALTTR